MFASPKPPFGGNAANTSFGFGSNTPAPFGQTQNMFGATGNTSTFGAVAPAFGQTSAPMFGTTQQSAPLFGSSFGATNQPSFGTGNLFGQQAQQPANTSLFGAANTSFGQQNKPTGFSFQSTQPGGGLFGATTTQPPQTNMFQPSTSTNIFGSTGFGSQSSQTGTTIKFVPVTGTDSMQKGGSSTMINTKHHSITCMKEYEGKSFEELRFEDYVANRKGPQQSTGFGTTPQPFGATASTAPTPSLFGQPENKSTFGTGNTFGQPFGLNTQPSTSQNVFGKPNTGFGTTITTASTFGFTNTPSTSIFGANTANKPFGTQTTTNLFGTTPQQPSTGFGSTNFFGQNPTTQPNFFNKPAQPTFQAAPTGSFSFGQQPTSTQANSIFQPTKPTTGFTGLFGQNTTTTSGFGQPNSSFGLFNSFNKPGQSAFGQPTQTANTGFGLQSNNLFGQLGNKSAFGTTGSTLFSGSNLQPNSSFNLPTQPVSQPMTLTGNQPSDARQIVLSCDPFGFAPHLEGLSREKPAGTHYVTNPKELADVLVLQDTTGLNTINSRKIRTESASKDSRANNKFEVYEAAYDLENNYGPLYTSSKENPKRLVLKVKPQKVEPILFKNDKALNTSVNDTSSNGILSTIPRSFLSGSFNLSANEESQIEQNNLSIVDKPVETESKETADTSTKDMEPKNSSESLIPKLTEENQMNKSPPNTASYDTCGITCTRPEYYTLPPLTEISKYKNDDGSCFIQGFTIGRIGYGNVHFPDEMDVSNLNIDEIVHFRSREICVYTDDKKKPPIGEGLNRRAQVTLDNVFPKKDDNSSEEERDPEVIIVQSFRSTVQAACERAGTTFVDYRPESGSWVFNVQHFSKYGLTELEEEQCKKEVLQKRAMEEQEARQEAELRKKEKDLTENLEQIKKRGLGGVPKHQVEKEISMMTTTYTLSTTYPTYSYTSTTPLEISALPIHSPTYDKHSTSYMKALFFGSDSNDEGTIKTSVIERNKSPIDLIYSDEAEMDSMTFDRDQYGDYECEMHYEPIKKITNRRFKIMGPPQIPQHKSHIPKRGIMDIAMLKGRSFKVGWGRGFTMTILKDSLNLLLVDASSLLVETNDPFGELSDLQNHMDIVLKESSYTFDKDMSGQDIPFFEVKSSTQMLIDLQELSQQNAQHANNPKMEYYASIWNLCITLWSQISKKDCYNTRRELFSNWLEDITRDLVRNDIDKNKFASNENRFKNIITYLSGHQIFQAASIAENCDCPQLSLLLSQLNANTRVRFCMQHQVNSWIKMGGFELIKEELLKVYLIVCGVPCYNTVNVMQGLDWLRCLAMHFWYIFPSSKPLNNTIAMYEDAFERNGYAEKPYPIYGSSKTTWDILYHIMKLYCNNQTNLADMLVPATHTDDSTDYRLSWLLQQVFISLNVGLIDEKVKYQITSLYAAQLENLGLYKWSIFVSLFIPDVLVRRNMVLGILDRNITEGYEVESQVEKELVEELHIPVEWLHYVKAMKEQQLRRYWIAYRHLAYSQAWQECHQLAIKYIFPKLVANHEFMILNDILDEMEQNSNTIFRWKTSGGLIFDFIKLYNILHEKPEDINSDNAVKLFSELCTLVKNLKYYPVENSDQHMIVAEISKFTSVFFHLALKFIASTKNNYLSTSKQILSQLVMPADYKYYELVKTYNYCL